MRSWLHLDRQFEESADALGSVQVATSRRGRDCRPRSSQEPVAATFEGELYVVDVKLPGIEKGDQAAADHRVELAGLDVSWLIPMEPETASAGSENIE